jgi:exodeoxyribonuclease VII small subunit
VTQASFEELQAELEQIVGRLERGDVEVDEALQLWQRGEELLRLCRDRLATAEGRVEELARQPDSAADGPPG